MSTLPLEVIVMMGQTMAKVVPITIALAVVFAVLSHFWACNPGEPWWRKRELVTDHLLLVLRAGISPASSGSGCWWSARDFSSTSMTPTG